MKASNTQTTIKLFVVITFMGITVAISSQENVGINTTSPDANLHVSSGPTSLSTASLLIGPTRQAMDFQS